MISEKLFQGIFLLFLCGLLIGLGCSEDNYREDVDELLEGQPTPHSFLLSWQQDPTSTMTIDWHTKSVEVPVLQYRQEGRQNWITEQGGTIEFPYSDRLQINRLELVNLRDDQLYEFRFEPHGDIYKFSTMPVTLSRPIVFVTGGDVRHNNEWMRNTSRFAAAEEPDFALIGGDLAYADGSEEKIGNWYDYLKNWTETMITEDNRVIPHLASIGNHEVKQGYLSRYGDEYEQTDEFRKKEAPYYYSLIAFPGQPGYGVLDFGNYMSIILLDSNHSNPISGDQNEWLKSALNQRQNVNHIFPIYHVPAFPSVRHPGTLTTMNVRDYWVPQFEEYGIRVAFENHDHAYKRTFPIKNGQIDEDGVFYIGDGAWGVDARPIGRDHDVDAWYLGRAESIRHFIKVTVTENEIKLKMINENGEKFDSLNIQVE